jgi:hypothetical protein
LWRLNRPDAPLWPAPILAGDDSRTATCLSFCESV